jgi:hypothetical protein
MAVNEANPKERKKLSSKLFRLDSPAKSSKQTLPVPRINGEGEHNCGAQTKNSMHRFVAIPGSNARFGYTEC